MSIVHAIILGIVQGIGEFLPISSSGHLVLIPYIFGWNYQGIEVDVALHFGTLLALLIFFWRDWMTIINDSISHKNDSKSAYPKNLLWILIIATIPGGILGYLLGDATEQAARNPLIVATFLVIFGAILWIVDAKLNGKKNYSDIGYGKGLFVGLAQAVSLFPGVSRSGITTTAGLMSGLSRERAMRFSFLLGVPITLGAVLLKLKDLTPEMVTLPFGIAILTSAIFGIISIKFLLDFLKKHGFVGFAIYRFALAALIVVMYFTR